MSLCKHKRFYRECTECLATTTRYGADAAAVLNDFSSNSLPKAPEWFEAKRLLAYVRHLEGLVTQLSDTASLSATAAVILQELRAKGWSVGVHNDYRLQGKSYTFWLMTRGNICVNGEGDSDLVALEQIKNRIVELGYVFG